MANTSTTSSDTSPDLSGDAIPESLYKNPLGKQRKISVQRYFEISLFAMLGIGFVTLALTGRLDTVSTLAVFLALIIRFWGYFKDADLRLQPRTVTRLSIFYIVFYLFDMLFLATGGPLQQMLQATVHLVLFTAIIKVYSASTHRDYIYLAVLSFLQMLAGAILTVDTAYFICFAVYILLAISTFISYEIKRSLEAAERPSEGPFREPDRNRSALEKSLMSVTAGAAVGILVLACGLFFLIPRYNTGYLRKLNLQPARITGFSETVRLGDIGRILESNVVVMRVIPSGGPKDLVGVKWRGIGLTSFDGKQWYRDDTSLRMVRKPSPDRFVMPRWDGGGARPRREIRYRVLRAAISNDTLFAAAEPLEIRGSFPQVAVDQTDSIHKPDYLFSPLQYEVVSNLGKPNPDDLRRASGEYPNQIRLTYLQLPQIDLRIAMLASEKTAEFDNDYDRAAAIERYLRDNFRYTLSPPDIDPQNPIGSFLFTSQAGYCEYFAASMTLMLRTLDIPARLVNGFQTGSYNPIGEDFIVRGRDAHSWVEVYFPGYGWVSFDPTPPDPNPVIAGVMDNYLDAVELFWQEWVINYDFVHQVRLARNVDRTSRRASLRMRDSFRNAREWGIERAQGAEAWVMGHKILVFTFLLLGFGFLLGAEKLGNWRELRFRWAWRFGGEREALGPKEASFAYSGLLSLLRKGGLKKSPSQTPMEFADSIERSPVRSAVREFTEFYNASRFGEAGVSISKFRELMGNVRAALAAGSKKDARR